ncbi:MAG: hypothetical protein RIS86_845 [Planctomycetota bacterium]
MPPLPTAFLEPRTPERFPRPVTVVANHALAAALGLDLAAAAPPMIAALLAGQWWPEDATPVALAYAGHQYGHFTMLGDGRAVLLGAQRAPDGRLVDLQWKGSGRTRFSRGGDGRAALGPMLREHLLGEAMHALDIATTRSLGVATTGETILRDGTKQGAVLLRVAASHLRVGTFQFAAGLGDAAALRALLDHAVARHDPSLAALPVQEKAAAFLRAVVARQAALLARWQLVGFVHGVMNTDNMTVSGETIDYGPCAFLDAYAPDTTFSSIDRFGRYAYRTQPGVAQWNLARLAEALVPVLDADEERAVGIANDALAGFPPAFRAEWLAGMRRKTGLAREEDDDQTLAQSLLAAMEAAGSDFTRTFRALSMGEEPAELVEWMPRWHARLEREARPRDEVLAGMREANPAIIPRNHRVEEALAAAEGCGDLAPFERLLRAVSRPFDPPADLADLAEPPPPEWRGYRTFCGT